MSRSTGEGKPRKTSRQVPEWVGPYRIDGLLGLGSAGMVCQGRCPDTGEPVAVKLLRREGIGEASDYRREIRTLSMIRHPGVVQILTESIDPELPWYAMEFVPGRNLRKFYRRIWGDKKPREKRPPVANGKLPEVLSMMYRLCEPLAFVHGEGWVHRDLKPSNVILRPDGRPVLLDFGLVSRFAHSGSREDLIIEGRLRGTVAYMAPEQVQGHYVDARADLYSLGCILYELVTGVRPFSGSSNEEISLAHLLKRPARPSSLVEGLPPELEKLLERLLTKRPRDRIGYALVLARALKKQGAFPAGGEEWDTSPPRIYLYPPGFVGQEEPMGRIMEGAGEAQLGEGSLWLLEGESGIGKTRLIKEVGRRCRIQGMQVFSGECEPSFLEYEQSDSSRATGPLAPFHQLLETAKLRCQRGEARCGGAFCDRYGCFLGRLLPGYSAIPQKPEGMSPLDESSEGIRHWLLPGLVMVLERLARQTPFLLILDDLQWADELTLGFLEHLASQKRLRNCPILILGTYRSEETGETLRQIRNLAGVKRVTLKRLGQAGVHNMVQEMLALPEPPLSMVRHLTRQSQGNPFFVSEYLWVSLAEGLLTLDSDGAWQIPSSGFRALPVPRSIHELADRRLNGLSEDARVVIDTLAVSAGRADPGLTQSVAGLPPDRFTDAIRVLSVRGLIDPPDERTLGIAYHQVAQRAYQQLSEERIVELHRATAEELEERVDLGDLGELGRHWDRAGQSILAQGWYHRGAWSAMGQFAYEEAIRLFRSYLALAAEPDRSSVEVRIALAMRAHWPVGGSREARRELGRALREARLLEDPILTARCYFCLSSIQRAEGRLKQAVGLAERSLELYQLAGDDQAIARAMSDLARLVLRQGSVDQAAVLLDQALEIQHRIGDRENEAISLDRRGQVRMVMQDPAGGLALQEKALTLQIELGDRYAAALTQAGTAVPLQALGRLLEARDRTRESLSFFREIGHRRMEAKLITNLASLEQTLSPQEALVRFREALVIHREIGEREWEGICLASIGEILLEGGQPKEAEENLEQAMLILGEVGDPAAGGIILANLERARQLRRELKSRLA